MAVAMIQSGLAGQLLEEYEGYCTLASLLEREQEALIDVASDRVAALAGEKERVTHRLKELGARRVALLQAQGVSGDASGMRAWLTGHPEQARQIGSTWSKLSEKAEQTRRQNQTNGRLIDALVQHLQTRLNMISSATCANPTYGPTGKADVIRFPSGLGLRRA